MRRTIAVLALALLLGTTPTAIAFAADPTAEPARKSAGYDPTRDPARDLAAAVERAGREHKRILLEVGGEWCIWCHILDEFLTSHAELGKTLANDFVVVKVNFSKEQKNEAFLGRYPKVAGYPHLFVLEADGTLLHSQDTGELEAGKSYDEAKLAAFFARWVPGK